MRPHSKNPWEEPIKIGLERMRDDDDDRDADERPRKRRRYDDDDDDDRPVKKRRRAPAKNDHTLLFVLLGGGAVLLLLFLVGVGVAGYFFFRAIDRALPPDRPNIIAKGKVVFNQQSRLAITDPVDPTPDGQAAGARMKVFTVAFQPGKTYVISLKSNAFDPYLRLESPKGQPLGEDDDGGDNLNALIVYRATEAGNHRVVATSYDRRTGPFHLSVQEAE